MKYSFHLGFIVAFMGLHDILLLTSHDFLSLKQSDESPKLTEELAGPLRQMQVEIVRIVYQEPMGLDSILYLFSHCCLSVCLSVCLSLHLYHCLPLFVHLSFYPPSSPSFSSDLSVSLSPLPLSLFLSPPLSQSNFSLCSGGSEWFSSVRS